METQDSFQVLVALGFVASFLGSGINGNFSWTGLIIRQLFCRFLSRKWN